MKKLNDQYVAKLYRDEVAKGGRVSTKMIHNLLVSQGIEVTRQSVWMSLRRTPEGRAAIESSRRRRILIDNRLAMDDHPGIRIAPDDITSKNIAGSILISDDVPLRIAVNAHLIRCHDEHGKLHEYKLKQNW